MSKAPDDIAEKIKAAALDRGASACGIVSAVPLAEFERYRDLVGEPPAGLEYLNDASETRADVRKWYGHARSVLVCAFQYWHPGRDYEVELARKGEPLAYLRATRRKLSAVELVKAAGHGKLSRYTLVPDYHTVIKGRLDLLMGDIAGICPGVSGKIFVDTSPVMEKELGRLAGLGFRGRNTLLISEELGSYFFIGGIALSVELRPDQALNSAGCGDCRKCEDACPVGALDGGHMMPGFCVSYLTTQAPATSVGAAAAAAVKKSGYIYGCDICQEVCPYNAKAKNKILLKEFTI